MFRYLLVVLPILLTNQVWASPEDTMCEVDEDLSLVTSFQPFPYILDEFNDPEVLRMSDSWKYTTKKYEHCDNGCNRLSHHNANAFAEAFLWWEVETTRGDKTRWSCGGELNCAGDQLSENVQCSVEISNCDKLYCDPYCHVYITEVVDLECRGDLSCVYEGRPLDECCQLVGGGTL